jgi:hypothetical protein
MVAVDANLALTGPDGPVTLIDAFEGRRHLVAYGTTSEGRPIPQWSPIREGRSDSLSYPPQPRRLVVDDLQPVPPYLASR